MPKFCDECKSLLTAEYGTTLNFKCEQCNIRYKSDIYDTIRFNETLITEGNTEKYNVFMSNAAHDPVGRKVNIECSSCHNPFMTITYVGREYTAFYVCTCGVKELVSNRMKSQKDTE